MPAGSALPLAAALVISLAGSPIAAAITYTAQDRSLDVTSTGSGSLWEVSQNPFFPDFDPPAITETAPGADSSAAPDFSPFVDTLVLPSPNPPFISPDGVATATQDSSLSPARIDASGSYETTRDAGTIDAATLATISMFLPGTYDFGISSDSQSADSLFSTTFDLAAPAPYRLRADVVLSSAGGFFPGDTTGVTSVELREAGGPGLASVSLDQLVNCPPPSCSDSLDVSGTLPAGSYELTAEASGSALGLCLDVGGGLTCFTSPSSGSFDVELLVSPQVPALPLAARALLAAALALGPLALSLAGRPRPV